MRQHPLFGYFNFIHTLTTNEIYTIFFVIWYEPSDYHFAECKLMKNKLECLTSPLLDNLISTFEEQPNMKCYIYIYIIQFICILESQVVECSMGSFYTQRF